MKRIKEKQFLPPSFYSQLNTSQVSESLLLSLLHKRLKILKMVEDGVQDMNLIDMTREEDVLSHFIMRMVCSQVEWVFKWFVGAEAKFYKLKLGKIDNLEGLFYDILPYFERLEVVGDDVYMRKDSYLDLNVTKNDNKNDNKNVYKNKRVHVHFTKISSVFSKRLVNVKRGYCSLSHIDTLLITEFKAYLNRRKCPKGDSRLMKICRDVFVDIPIKKSDTPLKFHLEDKKYYPPCILSIFEQLEKTRHIKYNDRQALTLFLKECGMGVEECTSFLFTLFNIPRGDFDRLYLYNIRHNYGLEGKKADYGCYSCQKMAYNKNTSNLSGCPFVDNKQYVEKYCHERGVDIEDIYVETTNTSRCTRVLERITKEEFKKTVTTPLKYFVTFKEKSKVDDKK